MPAKETQSPLQRACRTTQVTCSVFGFSLLVWALAPAVVMRAVTGQTPGWQTFAVGGFTAGVGLVYIVLGVLAGRHVGWALWTVLVMSVMLFFISLSASFTEGTSVLSLYPVLLSGCTAATSWLALDARRNQLAASAGKVAEPEQAT